MDLYCDKCRLSSTCPEKGASPLKSKRGQTFVCRLIGNFGRAAVDQSILSPESKKKIETDGPATSYVEVPKFDEDSGKIYFKTTIIFHHPILHDREKHSGLDVMNRIYRRSYNVNNPQKKI